jgi:hypothetical protein
MAASRGRYLMGRDKLKKPKTQAKITVATKSRIY